MTVFASRREVHEVLKNVACIMMALAAIPILTHFAGGDVHNCQDPGLLRRKFTRRVRAGPLDSALRPLDPLACDSVLRQLLAKMGAGVLNCRLARSRHSEPTRRGSFVGGGIHPSAGLVVCNSALRQPVAQRLGAGALHLRRLYRSRISEPARCSLVVGVGIGTVSGCHFLSARGACSRACRNQALWAHQSHDGRI